MKNRSKVFSIFKTFFSKVNTQFDTLVKILQSDDAREYLSVSFQSFSLRPWVLDFGASDHMSGSKLFFDPLTRSNRSTLRFPFGQSEPIFKTMVPGLSKVTTL